MVKAGSVHFTEYTVENNASTSRFQTNAKRAEVQSVGFLWVIHVPQMASMGDRCVAN